MNDRQPASWLVRVLDGIATPAGAMRILYALLAVGLVLVLVGWLIPHHDHDGAGIAGLAARIPGFYGIFALVMGVLLVLAAKALRRLLMRPEAYYAPRSIDSEDNRRGDNEGEGAP